jgi:hypothetical protein
MKSTISRRPTSLSSNTNIVHLKTKILCSALEDLSRMQSLLLQRQGDLSHPKCALGCGATVARTWGDTYSHVSSQLEVNTLKRDVDRLEDKLSHWRKDVGDREDKTHDLDPCNRAAWSWIRSGGLPNIFEPLRAHLATQSLVASQHEAAAAFHSARTILVGAALCAIRNENLNVQWNLWSRL